MIKQNKILIEKITNLQLLHMDKKAPGRKYPGTLVFAHKMPRFDVRHGSRILWYYETRFPDFIKVDKVHGF